MLICNPDVDASTSDEDGCVARLHRSAVRVGYPVGRLDYPRRLAHRSVDVALIGKDLAGVVQ